MFNVSKIVFLVCAFSALCRTANADVRYDVTLNTAPLVGHPAGPFSILFVFTDGSGVGDANNTVTVSNVNFGSGSSLGSTFTFGGASGSLETGVTITDSSFLSLFDEWFAPGLQLSFSLDLTLNDDSGGIPDRFTFFVLDNSGVPLPTLAPVGDYFFGADLGSGGPIFDAWGSDQSRAPTIGSPISIAVPAITLIALPVPTSGSNCNGAYNGTFDGNLIVSSGQFCMFVSGGITGNVVENGGNLVLSNATVGGNLQVQGGGSFSIGSSAVVNGDLQIQNIPPGTTQNQVCGTTVRGNLQFQNNSTAVQIGSVSPACAANMIGGNLTLQNNTAPATVVGNTVGNNLTVQNNSAATTVDRNAVNGNLQDQNNTAPTQVFNNVIGKNLLCQQDSSITGGGNTAKSKQGQCVSF